ncbi:hypothetical protein BGZ47_011268 [Haplosporangium gracile]|nr:hypothetical protein BGZ47_011268 [Haplosporangium gracile]
MKIRQYQKALSQSTLVRTQLYHIGITNATDITDTTNVTDTANTKILSEVDRRLLNILCPAFSHKDLVECSKKETDQEP